MSLCLRRIISVAIVACGPVFAQHIGTIEHPINKLMKFENGLIISWHAVSKDANTNQVEVFDEHGQRLVALSVLRPVQDAKSVTIYDVSARLGRMIAVSAVYGSNQGNLLVRPAATLLLFDFSGQLLSAFSLKPSREISRLAVDEESNVWTLTAGADGKDPSTVPMVVEYTSNGAVAKELLRRNMFPLHASETKENQIIGSPWMGYDSNGLWFWLPGSTEMVTVPVTEGTPVIVKTGLPKGGREEVPLTMIRRPSGDLVSQFREDGGAGKSRVAQYMWSPSAKTWVQFNPADCDRDGNWLIGSSDKGIVYVRHETDRSEICLFAGH